jgi:hypothetical protein
MSVRPEPRSNLAPGRKLLRFLRLCLRPRVARKLGTIATDGYLADTGWIRSIASDAIVDAAGDAQPWATFPFIAFIGPRLEKRWTIFEYGAGASTLYYARRVQRVVTVEDNAAFAARLRPQLPANVSLMIKDSSDSEYALAVNQCAPEPHFVSVDGNDRTRCVEAAIPRLAAGGVLVLDDAERAEYGAVSARLRESGFRSVEFWGLAPGIVFEKCTTVFYRPDNVLGL